MVSIVTVDETLTRARAPFDETKGHRLTTDLQERLRGCNVFSFAKVNINYLIKP